VNEISSRANEGAGIKNMQKRTAMIEGNFSMESSIGSGTRVLIHLPLFNIKER
jgi:signal transduction histidine kinase